MMIKNRKIYIHVQFSLKEMPRYGFFLFQKNNAPRIWENADEERRVLTEM